MSTKARAISGWLAGVAAVIALAGCHPGVGAAGSQQPASTSVVGVVAATPSTTSRSNPPAPAGQQSSDLAAVRSDLAGIDAGNSQADLDESAGDSARAQDDNN